MAGLTHTKSSILIIATLTVFLAFQADAAFAQSGSISAGGAEGDKGQTIQIAINLNGGSGVGAFGCDVGWDSSVLTFVDADKGGLVPDDWTFIGNPSGSSVRIGGYGTPDINGSGAIAVITFQIKESADSGNTTISVSGVTDGLSAGGGGTVDVLDCIIDYDVNGDSFVTPGDALMVFKHYLGTELISDQCALKKADANGDSSITPGDALIIFKEYLGIN